MAPQDREFMEERFGTDFSRVRVNTSAEGQQVAGRLGARAFALGYGVVFAAGEYRPGNESSRRLLAHELTHVVQQRRTGESGLIQAEFALRPSHPEAEATLSEEEVAAAIPLNSALLTDPVELSDLRDVLGVNREPAVVDAAFVRSLATFQAQFGLPVSGQLDSATRRQLAREAFASSRQTDSFDDDYATTTSRALSAFGLESDDFARDDRSRYRGLHALNPAILRDLRTALAAPRMRRSLDENVRLLGSVDDSSSGVALDLPFVLALGSRESGVRSLFSSSTERINTAGRDTHPEGRSGMDYFYRQHRAFTDRGQDIDRVETGLRPGRQDREPALIERRRLLLAFLIKTAQDELSLRRLAAGVLADLQTPVTADQLFAGLSIDALRTWKALTFAGVGYTQNALRAVLGGQLAAGDALSLEAVLTLDQAPDVNADRLDRARAVALAALALEGDFE
jgi:Domain of unknown function (DUF4157)/Putative peptidoglycan binding domain